MRLLPVNTNQVASQYSCDDKVTKIIRFKLHDGTIAENNADFRLQEDR